MGVSCKILVNKTTEGVHRAGQPVSGVVNYHIDKPTSYTDVFLSLIGEGRCSWTERDYSSVEERDTWTTYTGNENYVNRRVNMLNKLPGVEVTLPFGSYQYPFEFILPRNIPSSFSDSTCTISYRLEVKFAKPGLFSMNRNIHVEIPVYGHVYHSSPSTPLVFGVDKVLFKPFSNKQQAVKLKGQIDRLCLLPGQNAHLSYVLTNNTDIVVVSVIAEIVCSTTYTADCGRQKSYSSSVKETIRGTVCVPSDTVANLSSIVPILPQFYSIQNSKVMKKSYALLITVRLPMPHVNATVSVPIVIGEMEGAELCIESFELEELTEELQADEPPSYEEAMNEIKV